MPKKKWKKPKLVVLVRGKSEERVLQGCKQAGGGGASDANNDCFWFDAFGGCPGDPCFTFGGT